MITTRDSPNITVNNEYQYEDNDIQTILSSRLQQIYETYPHAFIIPIHNIHILAVVDDIAEDQLLERLQQEKLAYQHQGQRIALIPCNLGNYHWIGILLEFKSNGEILRAEFFDPLRIESGISPNLQNQLSRIYPGCTFQKQKLLEQSDGTSCGVYTVENLLFSIQQMGDRHNIRDSIQLRRLHLESVAQYEPAFYTRFHERQLHNQTTVAILSQQFKWLENKARFSLQELQRIFEIVDHINQIKDIRIQDSLWRIFPRKDTVYSEIRVLLISIRIQLAAVANSLNEQNNASDQEHFKQLVKLLIGFNWAPGTALEIENRDFRLSYNELVTIDDHKTDSAAMNKQSLAMVQRQIAFDEKLARKLQQQFDDETLTITVSAELGKLYLSDVKHKAKESKEPQGGGSGPLKVDLLNTTLNIILETLSGLDPNHTYKFDFSENEWLGTKELSQITQELFRFHIVGLSLADTNLLDEGISVLLKLLQDLETQHRLTVEELDLSGCGFGNSGFINICEFFSRYPGCLHSLDLQEVIKCNAASVTALRGLIEKNPILRNLLVNNLLVSEEECGAIVKSLSSNPSLEEFLMWDSTYIYHDEQIDIITWKNKTQRLKRNAFESTADILREAEKQYSSLYLVQTPDGNFNVANQTLAELIRTNNPKSYVKRLIKNDAELLCHLIDKFIYKIKHYEKYERDLILGHKEHDHGFMLKFAQYLRNTMMIAQAINYVHPNAISLDNIKSWKILSYESDPGLNNRIIAQDVLRPFEGLIKYLEGMITVNGRQFGDDLSDDSDEEDAAKFSSTHKHEKHIELLRKIKKLKEEKIPNFNRISYYTTPKEAGLVDKLRGMRQDIDSLKSEDRVPNPETWVLEIRKIIEGFDKTEVEKVGVKLKRAELPATSTQIAQKDAFNRILDQYDAGLIPEQDFQKYLDALDAHFVISQFRGINYLIDRWNHGSRRFHRKLDETNQPMYAESIFKTLPFCYYTQLDEDHNPQLNENKKLLKKEAVAQSHFLQELNGTGFVVSELPDKRTHLTATEASNTDRNAKLYLFNSVSDYFQMRFSNGINLHLQGLRRLQKFHSSFWRRYNHFPLLSSTGLPNAYNYAIASGDRPLHALYYALGDKSYYRYPLQPRYHRDGTPEYQHVGKVYVSLHRPSEFLTRQINRTSLMYKKGYLQLREGAAGVAPEKESSFLGFNEGNKIFLDWVMKVPSFKIYHPIYELKYGLTPELFTLFKWLFEWSYETDRNLLDRRQEKNNKNDIKKAALELLIEWLCSYWEILLLHLAAEEANSLGLTLIYLNWDGRLSFDVDPGNLHRASAATTPEANFRKELRMKVAQKLQSDAKSEVIDFDEKKCPGFSIVSDIDVGRAISTLEDKLSIMRINPADFRQHQTTLFFQRNIFSSLKRKKFDPQVLLDNDDILCSFNRAVILYNLNRYEDALIEFNKLLVTSPRNISFLTYRGNIFYHLKHFDQSLIDYTHALEIEPNNSTILTNCGHTLFYLNRIPEAIAVLDRSLTLKPDDPLTLKIKEFIFSNARETKKTSTLN